VPVTLLLTFMCAVPPLAFAQLPSPSPQPAGGKKADGKADKAADKKADKGGRTEKPCSCQEIVDYAKVVQKKFDAFKRITRSKKRFKSYGDFRVEFQKQMGWTQSWSEGKGGLSATDDEKLTALQQCRKEHCDWICDVSIYGVHEKYHPWFDHNYMVESFFIDWALDKVSGGYEHAMDRYIASELGAHDVELQFLQENIRQMQNKEKCEGLSGTPSESELENRFRVSRTRMTNYVRSWQR
jgi:hypothetical protein